MLNFWNYLQGTASVRVVAAAPEEAVKSFTDAGIVLQNIIAEDELTLQFDVQRKRLRKIAELADRHGWQIEIIKKAGLSWKLEALRKRPVLLAGLLLLLVLGLFLPTRILFCSVEGNYEIPQNLILEKAAQCGIRFGASRRQVRSERMKNALLEAIPQLQWAGINTDGCTAVISVREKPVHEGNEENKYGVSSIVAIRDGVIQECTVTKGSAACRPGQGVSAGQLLISGYTDCGNRITATRAEGEVYAVTKRQIHTEILPQYQKRVQETISEKKYSVIIGKKRINFYKGSGILDAGCVKMYKENFIMLPGGFRLPVAIVKETWTHYRQVPQTAGRQEAGQFLPKFTEDYLLAHMTAGQILTKQEQICTGPGKLWLDGQYSCLEMIGAERSEEIIKPNE